MKGTCDTAAGLRASKQRVIAPHASTQVGSQSVVDLSSEEEPCATAALRIAVNAQAHIVGITKSGSGGLDPTLTLVRVCAWQCVPRRGRARACADVPTPAAASNQSACCCLLPLSVSLLRGVCRKWWR